MRVINLVDQHVVRIPSWRVATVVACPSFAGLEVDWSVTLGPSDSKSAVFLIGGTWDAVLGEWNRPDPLTTVWTSGPRDYRFQRRDYVHAECGEQVIELRGAKSCVLTFFFDQRENR